MSSYYIEPELITCHYLQYSRHKNREQEAGEAKIRSRRVQTGKNYTFSHLFGHFPRCFETEMEKIWLCCGGIAATYIDLQKYKLVYNNIMYLIEKKLGALNHV